MEKIKCLVIDDEPLACRGMLEYISEIDSLQVIGTANNPAEALKFMNVADLMYLDINMPVISGIDFLKQIKNPPLTIITTAYQQYALEGFELDVVDYLLKPISFQRFLKATTKAIEYHKLIQAEKKSQPLQHEYFFVKSNGILEKIMIADINSIESLSNYIIIHLSEKNLTVYLTLKQINDFLPENSFLQVHKSHIVAIDKIHRMDTDSLTVNEQIIPVGANYRAALIRRIGNRILKR